LPTDIAIPQRHHLDRRADAVAASLADGADDDLLSTKQLARKTGLSVQFFEIGRHRGYGPRFVRLSPRRIRYARSAVLEWLAERTYQATREYETGRPRKAGAA
jgi:predicted DNA-binding transcriptional regulator AlpA